jgi:pimeloyl-ACP methyl ester carboxylesterase
MAETAASRTVLVGWSGGGALAVLVAARRTDVTAVLTLAAPLDLAAWTTFHRATPLRTSIDPASLLRSIASIPQIHAAAADDRTVPPGIVAATAARAGVPSLVVPGDHTCCWARVLPELVRRVEVSAGHP